MAAGAVVAGAVDVVAAVAAVAVAACHFAECERMCVMTDIGQVVVLDERRGVAMKG